MHGMASFPSTLLPNYSFKSFSESYLTNSITRSSHFSHIASGYLYHSPSNQKVRVDATHDLNFASSLFDYGNVSSDGLVSNAMYTLEPSIAARPRIYRGYVKPGFPLFEDETLAESRAVFGGVVDDRYVGTVASVSPLSFACVKLLQLRE
jgi:hypothetical protein